MASTRPIQLLIHIDPFKPFREYAEMFAQGTHDRNTASDQGHVRLPRVIEFQRPLEAVALAKETNW